MSLSFLEAARTDGGRIAVIDGTGLGHTFGALAPCVAARAAALAEPGERKAGSQTPAVAVVGARSVSVLLTLWALVERGVAFALLDPRAPAAERRRRLAALGAPPVVDEGWTPPSAAPEASRLPEPVLVPDDERGCAAVFTSGTSGRPRAAILSRRAFVAAARASEANLGWRDDDRWLLCMPLSHVGGLSIVLRCLLARRALVLATEGRFAPREMAEQVARDRVTLVSLVPTMLWRLLEMEPPWRPPDHLRAVLLGGAPADRRLLARAADRGVPVLTTYGLTEACSQVTTQPLGTSNRGELGSGRPVRGVELRLVGEDGDSDAPSGRSGTIEVRGATLFSGYLGSDPAPSSRFWDPLTADGWLRTGDVGRLDDDGFLHVLGRRDEMITSGGEKVHPQAVEEALESHPGVARACVFAVDDEEWGQVVAATLVATDAGPPTGAELRDFVSRRLPPHERPRLFCWVDSLALTPSGKLDRRAVHSAHAARLGPLTGAGDEPGGGGGRRSSSR